MKHTIKKVMLLILVLGLCLSSCGTPLEVREPEPEPESVQPVENQQGKEKDKEPENQLAEQKRFDEFLQRDFIKDVTADGLSLHMTLQNPENYGITDYVVSWGDYLESEPNKEDIQETLRDIEEFRAFDRSLLTQEQQESYDIYSYYIDELFDENMEFFYHSNVFQGNHGPQYYIPIVLSEYQFTKRQDIDDYLTLCSQLDLFFAAQIQYEKNKSEKGLFMSDKLADDAIKGCKDYIRKKEGNILLLSFVERLDDVDFLSDSEKEEYISRNKEIFYDVVIPAYETAIAELELLKGTGKNDKGMAYFEKGKEYYAKRLCSMGITKTPEELIANCDNKIMDILLESYTIMMAYPELIDMFDSTLAPDMSVEEMVKYLKEKTAADFPTLPQETSYAVKIVDDSLKDFAPGFYLTPQLDNYKENVIYYSPDYADDSEMMFFMMAHEGFPGHLLQTVNLYSGPLSDFRKSCFFKSYVEGWAQYVEIYSYKYSEKDNNLVRLKQLDQEYMLTLQLRWDLGIHYEGWLVKDLGDYMINLNGNELPNSVLEEIYFSILKNPMETVPYAAGKYEVELLKEHYQSELGSGYSDKLFHEELLKRGAAPFILIEKWMDQALLGNSEGPSVESEPEDVEPDQDETDETPPGTVRSRGTATLF